MQGLPLAPLPNGVVTINRMGVHGLPLEPLTTVSNDQSNGRASVTTFTGDERWSSDKSSGHAIPSTRAVDEQWD